MNLGFFQSIWRKRSETESVIASFSNRAAMAPVALTEAKDSDEEIEPRRFVARQTIFDRDKKTFGYELLFRTGWESGFRGDTDEATRVMIADGALSGFHDMTRGAPAFVNCTRQSLVNGLVTLLPASTVLEIAEGVDGDSEVLEACTRYKSMGYKLALDDYHGQRRAQDLVALADFIKVDFALSDLTERSEILKLMAGRNVTMLATRIETQEEFAKAVAEGFTLFQGNFLSDPTVFSKKRLPTNGANYLYLLSALVQGDFHVRQLAILLQSEAALSMQLLRLVNSAGYAVDKHIESLEEALLQVGEIRFRILLLNAIATESCRGRSTELLIQVLHRARFLELMAEYTHENAAEQYLYGLLSLMDVMLGLPIVDLIEALPLRKEMKDALCGEPNSMSRALELFESYEDADWEHCMNETFALKLTESELTGIYSDALVWAENCVRAGEMRTLVAH
jgi:c-di-GMP-related signal transduction protein